MGLLGVFVPMSTCIGLEMAIVISVLVSNLLSILLTSLFLNLFSYFLPLFELSFPDELLGIAIERFGIRHELQLKSGQEIPLEEAWEIILAQRDARKLVRCLKKTEIGWTKETAPANLANIDRVLSERVDPPLAQLQVCLSLNFRSFRCVGHAVSVNLCCIVDAISIFL